MFPKSIGTVDSMVGYYAAERGVLRQPRVIRPAGNLLPDGVTQEAVVYHRFIDLHSSRTWHPSEKPLFNVVDHQRQQQDGAAPAAAAAANIGYEAHIAGSFGNAYDIESWQALANMSPAIKAMLDSVTKRKSEDDAAELRRQQAEAKRKRREQGSAADRAAIAKQRQKVIDDARAAAFQAKYDDLPTFAMLNQIFVELAYNCKTGGIYTDARDLRNVVAVRMPRDRELEVSFRPWFNVAAWLRQYIDSGACNNAALMRRLEQSLQSLERLADRNCAGMTFGRQFNLTTDHEEWGFSASSLFGDDDFFPLMPSFVEWRAELYRPGTAFGSVAPKLLKRLTSMNDLLNLQPGGQHEPFPERDLVQARERLRAIRQHCLDMGETEYCVFEDFDLDWYRHD